MPREHLDSRERKLWNEFKAAYRKANPKDHNDAYYKRVRAAYKAQTQGYTLDRWISNGSSWDQELDKGMRKPVLDDIDS